MSKRQRELASRRVGYSPTEETSQIVMNIWRLSWTIARSEQWRESTLLTGHAVRLGHAHAHVIMVDSAAAAATPDAVVVARCRNAIRFWLYGVR